MGGGEGNFFWGSDFFINYDGTLYYIVLILPMIHEKLLCKGEPYRFNRKLARSKVFQYIQTFTNIKLWVASSPVNCMFSFAEEPSVYKLIIDLLSTTSTIG